MTSHLPRVITTTVIVLGLEASVTMAQPGSQSGIDVPPVPPNIEVPSGHSAFLKGHAVGTQNYICLPVGASVNWTFLAPQATLFQMLRSGLQQQITTHFLSPNPTEGGMPRPTWQHSFDTSQVWGRAIASSNDPNFVQFGAIPWLLVQVVGTSLGPSGGSFLMQTTFIQRLNTLGGVSPTTGCGGSADIGKIALVPYAADYFFYKASRER